MGGDANRETTGRGESPYGVLGMIVTGLTNTIALMACSEIP
jgi:hypothetical protein